MAATNMKNSQAKNRYDQNLNKRYFYGKIYYGIFFSCLILAIIGLVVLLSQIVYQGIDKLTWTFISNFPSRHADQAGILPALFGSIWLMVVTGLIAIPFGIGCAIYLEEYAPKNKFTQLIEINISNLAGVPSIVYGLLGLALFVNWFQLGRSIISGSLTMSLLVMPIVILASREAIKQIPTTRREAAYALGATRWEVVRFVVIPSAIPSIMTGVILAMSRAIGETAPIIAISAVIFIREIPTNLKSDFTVIPLQIYNWVSRPQDEFRDLAAAGILALLLLLLSMNSIAIFIRSRYQNKSEE
tara:strand:+ start:6880 stop:7782 length:903 start_codon:yes stop_codon:yes gene_type:complete